MWKGAQCIRPRCSPSAFCWPTYPLVAGSSATLPIHKLAFPAGLSLNLLPLLHSQYWRKIGKSTKRRTAVKQKEKNHWRYLPRLFLARPLPVSMRATSKAQVQSHCMVNPPPPVTDHNPRQSSQLDVDTYINTRATHNWWVCCTKICWRRPVQYSSTQATTNRDFRFTSTLDI